LFNIDEIKTLVGEEMSLRNKYASRAKQSIKHDELVSELGRGDENVKIIHVSGNQYSCETNALQNSRLTADERAMGANMECVECSGGRV
jgi:hypothetical protein